MIVAAELQTALKSIMPDHLQTILLADSVDISSSPIELQSVQKLAEVLPFADDPELQAQLNDVISIVKALSRVVIRYTSATALDENHLAKHMVLDDRLLPFLRVLHAFVTRRRELGMLDDKEMLQWLPFVLTACCFVSKADLPGADSMQSVTLADKTLVAAVDLTKAEDLRSLIAKYVAQIVALCSQDVNKQQWVQAASINKKIMLKVVEQVPFPHLGGDLLGRLLALTFPLVDDLSDTTQLVGARLLRHIIRNVTPTEVRWYSNVLLEVLHTAIVSRKPRTLDVLLNCLIESLDMVSSPGDYQYYDRFTLRLLNDASLCSDVKVRMIYVRHVQTLVIRQGAPHSLNAIRYLQPLLKVLIAGFESVNAKFLIASLEALKTTVLATWPRIASHTEQILVGVLRAVAFCEMFDDCTELIPSSEDRRQILALCEDVLDLLHNANTNKSAVSDMLGMVGSQCPKLTSFCTCVQEKVASR